MLNHKLTVSILAVLVATSSVAFADDDDDASDESSSESSESYERPAYYEQAAESAGEKALEMSATYSMGDEAAGSAMKASTIAYKLYSEDDPNKNVDTLISAGVEYGVTLLAGATAGSVAGSLVVPTYTAPSWSTDDGNHPQYQGTALGDSGMIVEPAEDQTDPEALQIEPVSDDESFSIAVGSSSQTSTPAPQSNYTPPTPATPVYEAPSYTPSYSSGHSGSVPAM